MKRITAIICSLVLFYLGFAQNNPDTYRTIPKFSIVNQISIGDRMNIESKVFNEDRRILISLPAGYAEDNRRYPVIYFTDGSSIRLQLIRGVVSFIADMRKMPDAILVGISHKDRNKELTPYDPIQVDPDGFKREIDDCGGADQLLEFIRQELIPVIESNYRTLPTRIYVGHSYGGLFGIYSMFKYPEMFQANIAIDPSIWWKAGAYVDSLVQFLKENPTFQCSLYASKTKSEEKYWLPFNKLHDFTKSYSNPLFKYNFLDLPESEDHQSSVLPTLYSGLIKIFEEYQIHTDFTLEDIKARNDRLILGATYKVPESTLNGFGYYLLGKNKYDEAIAAFEYCTSLYPDSWNAYDSLAEAYMKAGNKKLAVKNYEKSLKLNPENSAAVEQLKILKK